MAFGRLPNGIGNVSKITYRKLRRPWRARKEIARYKDENGKIHREYHTVGYFQTRKEAIDALMNDTTIPVAKTETTFERVYLEWSAKKYPELSAGSAANYRNAYSKFDELKHRQFRDLKTADYEAVITDRVPDTIRSLCKLLLSQLYQYAIRHEMCEKDYSKFVDFKTNGHQVKDKAPFSVEEVERLWSMVGNRTADLLLVGIYSGLRPTEMLTLQTNMFEDGCFVCGMKTKNGKNRRVPIHPRILPIIQDYCLKSTKLGVRWLFPSATGKAEYVSGWGADMKRLFPDHTPHETRHSFATYAKKSGMDRYIVKRIMGHAIDDLTEQVYTHTDTEQLKAEMAKYRVQ